MVSNSKYPLEILDENDDNGTMPRNVSDLENAVIGHRIIKAQREKIDAPWEIDDGYMTTDEVLVLTLDDGTRVELADSVDCCAYTELKSFFAHPEMVDHVITGVGTTGKFTKWHIYADFGDVLTLDVGWSCGNPFYSFHIAVRQHKNKGNK